MYQKLLNIRGACGRERVSIEGVNLIQAFDMYRPEEAR
jgi:hypothetical protein